MGAVPWIAALLLGLLGACSDGPEKSRDVPCEGRACGIDAGSSTPIAKVDAGRVDSAVRPATFVPGTTAGAELQARLQVNGARVGCGACAVLVAQAQGGQSPYSYQWSEPSLSGPGPHMVCPTQPTDYSVVVKDSSEVMGGEFAAPAQEVEATGKVDCVADAGSEGLIGCFSNGGTDAGAPDPDAGVTCPEPDDAGVTFDLMNGTRGTVTVSTKMPQPFKAGSTYEYSHDRLLPFTLSVGDDVKVDVYGAKEECKPAEKLFTLVYDIFTWHQSFCFTPTEDYSYLIVQIHLNGALFSFEFLASGTACAGCSTPTAPPP